METITFITSLLAFYLKGEVRAEQNFLMLKAPHTILGFVPFGAQRYNLPINQISSVGTSFRLFFKDLVVGIVEIVVAFALFSSSLIWALILLFLGASTIINSFQTDLIVSTTSGSEYTLSFFIFEKGKALTAEHAINRMINYRLNDTNVRAQTENQTAALNSAQAANTQAIINAINSNNKNN